MDADLHLFAVALMAAAGLGYLVAAVSRWRRLADADRGAPPATVGWWFGIALQGAVLAGSLAGPGHRDFAYACLAAWAMVAALLFASRSLGSDARGVLALPLGAVLVLVAVAGLASRDQQDAGARTAVVVVHAVAMTGWLAAALVAGTAGGLRLLAARQLKSNGTRALRLPALPALDRVIDRALALAAAALLAGVATGGAAGPSVHLLHPAIISAVVALLLAAAVLALMRLARIGRRAVALAALALMALGCVGILAQVLAPHG